MFKVIVSYLLVVNLCGLIFMYADKWKAKHNRWRIPERTLFLSALLGGSPGVLAGMYLFRHKTKHRSFTLGIPAILFAQLVIAAAILLSGCSRKDDGAAELVKKELSLVKELDEDAIRTFISYESLMGTNGSVPGEVGEDTTRAIRAFFAQFDYKLTDQEVEKDSAVITAEITNVDTKALARDLCRTILEDTLSIHPEKTLPTDLNGYFRLLLEALEGGSYPLVTTEAHFHLVRQDDAWIIEASDALEDELVGGFITYMNDPYLLSAQEVLEIYLDEFQSLPADEWISYLQVSDLFNTYSNYAALIDEAFFSQVAGHFAYTVDSCTETDDRATAQVTITSLDLPAVFTAYRAKLVDYAGTSQSMRLNTSELTDATAKLLLDELDANTAAREIPLELTLTNNGSSWELVIDDNLTDAILGGMSEAMSIFQEPDNS